MFGACRCGYSIGHPVARTPPTFAPATQPPTHHHLRTSKLRCRREMPAPISSLVQARLQLACLTAAGRPALARLSSYHLSSPRVSHSLAAALFTVLPLPTPPLAPNHVKMGGTRAKRVSRTGFMVPRNENSSFERIRISRRSSVIKCCAACASDGSA